MLELNISTESLRSIFKKKFNNINIFGNKKKGNLINILL